MRLLFLSAFLFLAIASPAQLDVEKTANLMTRDWTSGEVTQVDGQKVQLQLRLNLINYPHHIELRRKGLIYFVPLSELREFSLYDSSSGHERFFAVAKLKNDQFVAAEYHFRKSLGAIVTFRFIHTTVHHAPIATAQVPLGGAVIGVGPSREVYRNSRIDEELLILNALTREALPLSGGNLLRVFHPQKNEIKKFLKKEKIKFSVYKDYLRVIAYIDTLPLPGTD